MPNLFYIQPGTNYLTGLQGLQQGLEKQSEKNRLDKIKQGAMEVYRSGDPDQMAEYAIRNPEIGSMLTQMGKFRSESTKQNYLNSAYSLISDPSPENVQRVVAARQTFLKSQGQTDEDMPYTGSFMEKFNADPKGTVDSLLMEVAAMDPARYKTFREGLAIGTTKSPKTAMEAFLKQNPDATNEELAAFVKSQEKAKAEGKAEGTPKETPKEESVSSDLRDFEMVTYGHLVPELRGTTKYKDDRLSYLKQKRDVTTPPNKTEPSVLRKEFISQSKDFVKVRDSYNRIKASAKNPSPAGDLAMIFNYMKVLDPGSVVRESEFATAAQTGAYGERIKAAVSRVLNGQRLSDEMRKDFENRAKELYLEQEKSHNKLTEEYDRLSKEMAVEPSQVLINYVTEQVKVDNEEYDIGEMYSGEDGSIRRYDGKDTLGNHIWTVVE